MENNVRVEKWELSVEETVDFIDEERQEDKKKSRKRNKKKKKKGEVQVAAKEERLKPNINSKGIDKAKEMLHATCESIKLLMQDKRC